MPKSDSTQEQRDTGIYIRRQLLQALLLLMFLAVLVWPAYQALSSGKQADATLMTSGNWGSHDYDLLYSVAFSSPQRPDGPLMVYRASAADLRSAVPVVAVQRDAGGSAPPTTPQFFPAPDGRSLALLSPLSTGYAANLQGASVEIFSSDGQKHKLLLPQGAALADRLVWSRDGSALYYHTGVVTDGGPQSISLAMGRVHAKQPLPFSGQEAIHRVDLNGHDTLLWQRPLTSSSLQLVGVDNHNTLILSQARPNAAVELLGLSGNAGASQSPRLLTTLPDDILPGNILGITPDGLAVICQRVVQWQPLSMIRLQFRLNGQSSGQIQPLFATNPFGSELTPLARSADGAVLVMSRVTATRADLAAQGLADVPQRELLVLADTSTRASQRLTLPDGGQLVQAFWSPHVPPQQVQAIPQASMQRMFATPSKAVQGQNNAAVFQQDAWMLEAHANLLSDGPKLPTMCTGNCPQGLVSPPHVSVAIMHGVAYTESNWHQFNTSEYQILSEAPGAPVRSWDGGWGEYQQTWGMPPQCRRIGNCRHDYKKIQRDEAYNIGTGAQALINAWNGTAGVDSASDPNDPMKANHWFFAVWAYNGVSGNNPNDVPSDHYAHWYPGAPFRSIYEEYVWYYAAHPQFSTNHWTDNYLPGLGTALLPPQRAFRHTSDDFVRCVTCTIPDWTEGSFDHEWVGQGASDATITTTFQQFYNQAGGENVVGLPVDTGDGAAVHRWGKGWSQNMDGGTVKAGALLLADGISHVYLVAGGIWESYNQNKGPLGCHGYPTAAQSAYQNSDLGPDSYVTQAFQHGSIVWDTTNDSLAQDNC